MNTRREGTSSAAPATGGSPEGSTGQRWEIDTARSTLTFNLRHIVVRQIQGRFGRWGGTLFTDRRQPWLSSLEVWVDLDSVTTDDPERDAHVRSDELLNTSRFGRAELKSTAIELRGLEAIVEGRLDLHGVVHDVELRADIGPVTTDPDGRERSRYTVRGMLDRQSFGLHWNQDLDVGGVVVGDEVEIVARVELVRTDGRAKSPAKARPDRAG